MTKIYLSKVLKKNSRERELETRKEEGLLETFTRVKPSKKVYNRKTEKFVPY